MTEPYVEQFETVGGGTWWRAVDPQTRVEAIAATRDEAIQALARVLAWRTEPCQSAERSRDVCR